MFKRQSPVHKKGKVKRRVIDPSKRMLIKQLLIGFVVFSLIGIMVALLWYGTRVSALTITEVTASGGETIPLDKVVSQANETLEGNYLGLVPRRFSWWYPADEMLAKISEIPRIKNPKIEKTSGTSLAITFEEYEPYALWCPDRSGDNCLFVDSYGYAFGPAPKLQGGAFLRYRTLGREVAKGSTLGERSDLAKMEQFVARVDAELGFAITQIETDTAGDVFYIISGGGEFKATLKDSAEQVFDNLRTILASTEFSHIKPGNFQYIDLRFGNKVFVNEEAAVAATSTATSTDGAPVAGESAPVVLNGDMVEVAAPAPAAPPTIAPPVPNSAPQNPPLRPRPAGEELPV